MPALFRYLIWIALILLLACQSPTHSAIYPRYEAPVCIEHLDSQVRETSGLLWIDDQLWTHNDSGDEPLLYQLDPANGKVLRRIRIEGAENQDWEELASDSAWIYIGDMGNNAGYRDNLRIFKVSKAAVLSAEDGASVLSEGEIQFHYPEQENLQASDDHNFDCEAMVAWEGKLWLFTKNRGNQRSTLYQLPTDTGKVAAKRISEFDVQGTITGADFQSESGSLALVGYEWNGEPMPFLWVFPGLMQIAQFGKADVIAHRINFEDYFQMEAVVFRDENRFWISCEQRNTAEGRLFCLELDALEPLL
ncbi:MAG: hypothetical protein AAF399_22115 [Bacteroidota bacterium]